VAFLDGANTLGTATLNNSTASLTTTTLPVGTDPITAVYLPSGANFSLQSPVTMPTGFEPKTVVLADVNGDGKLDLVVDNEGGGSVSISLGNGNGTFQAPQTLAAGYSPSYVAVADLNGDGKPDLVVTNVSDNTVSVFLGNGNGTFQAATTFATGSGPFSVTVADVNGDGKPDLVVADQYFNRQGSNGAVSVLLGNGNGTFQAQRTFAAGIFPLSVAVGDLNGDGKPDLAVANFRGNSVGVLFGNGDGTFQAQRAIPTNLEPSTVKMADLNGDGKLDLIATSDPQGGQSSVCVFLGNGNGTFKAQHTYATAKGPDSQVVADVNGDGKLDLVTSDYNGNMLSVLLGNGNGTFQAAENFATGVRPRSVAVADINGDGKPDVVVADYLANTLNIFFNASTDNFAGSTSPTLLQTVNSAGAATTVISSISPLVYAETATFPAAGGARFSTSGVESREDVSFAPSERNGPDPSGIPAPRGPGTHSLYLRTLPTRMPVEELDTWGDPESFAMEALHLDRFFARTFLPSAMLSGSPRAPER
jgi:hypothetical protein